MDRLATQLCQGNIRRNFRLPGGHSVMACEECILCHWKVPWFGPALAALWLTLANLGSICFAIYLSNFDLKSMLDEEPLDDLRILEWLQRCLQPQGVLSPWLLGMAFCSQPQGYEKLLFLLKHLMPFCRCNPRSSLEIRAMGT